MPVWLCSTCKYPLDSIQSGQEATCPECGTTQVMQHWQECGIGLSRHWCLGAAAISQLPMLLAFTRSLFVERWALVGMVMVLPIVFGVSCIMSVIGGVWLRAKAQESGSGKGVFALTFFSSVGVSVLLAIGIFVRIATA